VKDATRKILSQLFSNNLARKMNFSGNGEKAAVANMPIRRVIIGTSHTIGFILRILQKNKI
jgi:hypothetical protein